MLFKKSVPAGWRLAPLDEHVFFQEGPGLRNWQYRKTGIPFVNIRCIQDGRLLRKEMTCLDQAEVEEKYKHFLLHAGDLVVSSSGTLGRLAEVRADDLPCMLNTSTIRFRSLDEQLLSTGFLKYFLLSPLFQEQIEAHANGSAQLNYGPSHLRAMKLFVPSIQEQLAIFSLLKSLDDRIENLRATNETLEAIVQTLFKSWFVDFDPVKAKAEGQAPAGMDAETAALFPSELEESELGLIPKGWVASKLGDIAEVVDCLHSKKPELTAEGKPYLQLNCVRDDGLLDVKKAAFISDINYEKWTSRIEVVGGDCVVTNVGRVGAVSQIPEGYRAAMGRNMTAVRLRKTAQYPTFLIELLQSAWMRAEIEKNTDEGTILNALNVRSIPKLRMTLPPRQVLDTFEASARPLRKLMEQNLAEETDLLRLRDTLLPGLIAGELRLPGFGDD